MSTIWTPLFAFMVLAVIFGLGDFIATKTKGFVSTIVVGCLVYLVGFWTKVIPTDGLDMTGLPALMGNFGIALLIVSLGTMINLEDFLKEWKTVVVAIFGLVGLAIGSFTIGQALFGRVYSLAASAPISGGIIAGIIVDEAAKAAGQPNIGGYAMLLVGFQMFIGLPLSSVMLKKEVAKRLKEGIVTETGSTTKKWNLKFVPDFPPALQSDTIVLAKLAIVATAAFMIAKLTLIPGSSPANYILNPNIAYLIFGVLFTEFGFLDKHALTKANSMGILMMGVIALLPGSLKNLTPQDFLAMLYPIIGTLLLGAIMISVFSVIMGKIVGYSPAISIAIGLTAMVGYPGTQILTNEVIASLDCSEEERERMRDYILPKMLVGGFTTVTIASVVFAGLVAPIIFS